MSTYSHIVKLYKDKYIPGDMQQFILANIECKAFFHVEAKLKSHTFALWLLSCRLTRKLIPQSTCCPHIDYGNDIDTFSAPWSAPSTLSAGLFYSQLPLVRLTDGGLGFPVVVQRFNHDAGERQLYQPSSNPDTLPPALRMQIGVPTYTVMFLNWFRALTPEGVMIVIM